MSEEPIERDLSDRVSTAIGAEVTAITELEGGLVGRVFRVSLAGREPVAVKVDDVPLENEARMLAYLADETALPVPAVHHVESGLLVMEYVDGDGVFDERAERALADHLAALHDISADAYGFPFDTLSGPFLQSNPWTDSWIDFFRDQRLLPFARAASEDGSLSDEGFERVQALAERLDDLLVEPAEPALLHGDLHPGNVVVDDGAIQAVIDPAIYFGHDELGLAYAERSPELGEAFLDQYRRHRPIPTGYFEERRDVYTAFHVLENVRYFGTEIRPQLDEALAAVGV